MKVVITGGGTGGHIFPAVAIAENLRAIGATVNYVGSRHSMEERVTAECGLPFFAVSATGLHRRSLAVLKDLAVNYHGCQEARAFLRSFAPDIVIGTGGYAEAPVVRAAQELHIKTLLHEQNAYPGLANRQLARRADAVCLTFAAAAPYFPHPERLHVTGLPVRAAIAAATKEAALACFDWPAADPSCRTLLITGGSQGAASINAAAREIVPTLLQQGVRVIWTTGNDEYIPLRQQVPEHPLLRLKPFLSHMEYALRLADLSVSRAGASFLSEAALVGLPMILAPFPYAANDHQRYNAAALAAQEAAVVVEDAQLNGATLLRTVRDLLDNPIRLQRMREQALTFATPDAAAQITAIALELTKKE